MLDDRLNSNAIRDFAEMLELINKRLHETEEYDMSFADTHLVSYFCDTFETLYKRLKMVTQDFDTFIDENEPYMYPEHNYFLPRKKRYYI